MNRYSGFNGFNGLGCRLWVGVNYPLLVLMSVLTICSHSVLADNLNVLKPTHTNIIYGMDHGSALLMDVYIPPKQNGYGLVFVMGTGFTAEGEYSDIPLKELDVFLLENGIFANLMGESRQLFAPAYDLGFTVFSINHRLAPKFTSRYQLKDVQRAVQFIRAHAIDYDIDPNWLAGMGHSSGASLIALLATSHDVAQPHGFDPVSRQSSRIQAAVPVSGIFDLLSARIQNPDSDGILSGYIGQVITYQPEGHPVFDKYKQASPITHVSQFTPPMMLIHGQSDDTVNPQQSNAMFNTLQKLKIQTEYLVVKHANHGAILEPTGDKPMVAAAQWLKLQQPQ